MPARPEQAGRNGNDPVRIGDPPLEPPPARARCAATRVSLAPAFRKPGDPAWDVIITGIVVPIPMVS